MVRSLAHRLPNGGTSGALPLLAVTSVVALLLALGVVSSALASGDVNEASCPNEALVGFSDTLPDCRSNELVTPPFQNGANDFELNALAADGATAIGASVGTYAGAESNPLGARYVLRRGLDLWEAASISPAAAMFPASQFYAASRDLNTSVWALRSGTQSIYAKDLFRREADGTFVKIGPMVPPGAEPGPRAEGLQSFLGTYEFAGASADLSHVFFTIHNGALSETTVWPGDTTGKFPIPPGESLYEYSGVGNSRPQLVGRNAQGRLISDCATYLGAVKGADAYNAVSADGSRVYFTALGHSFGECPENVTAPAVTQVWASVAGIEPVAISEPAAADCEACVSSAEAPAEFQGASEDGSKAFFTTAQELLPGAETTNLYEYDFNASRGKRIVRVSTGAGAPEVQGVVRVSEDGSHVYFVARRRLTDEPRGGLGGECLATETPPERAEEELTHEGRCRAKAGRDNLYVFERDAAHPGGVVSFAATLTELDARDWGTEDVRPAQATPDGRYLVFDSTADLTPGTEGTGTQVYELDASTSELVRLSRGQIGYPKGTEDANASSAQISTQSYRERSEPASANTLSAVSGDGATVMFVSPAALTPQATVSAEHAASSVYEYRSSGRIAAGDVYLLSGGANTVGAKQLGVDQSGANAFFLSADQLVALDANTGYDLYDARVDGGFATSEPPSCAGEACLGPLISGGAASAGGQPLPTSTDAPVAAVAVRSAGATPVTSRPGPKHSNALANALRACRHRHRGAARKRCERSAVTRLGRPQRASRSDRGRSQAARGATG